MIPIHKRSHSTWAILLGVLAMVSTMVFFTTSRAADRSRLKGELASLSESLSIPVSTRDLPRGTSIALTDVKWVKAVRAHIPDDIVMSESKIVGRETIADVFAGEPIVSRRISDGPAKRPSTTIQRGRVGLAIGVDEVAGVAGGVRAGDHVDVLVSRSDSGDTKVLYKMVRVLGVEGEYPFSATDEADPEMGSGARSQARAVVLELRPREAARLTQAVQVGAVRLALRAQR